MAKPRIFISSTYYDMRNVRADLERFIKEQGYEPILFEHGHIPYGKEDRIEDDCYREISTCDVLINLIGGKYGTESKVTQYSISQNELRTALKLGKQVYIFIERAVMAEYNTYLANKSTKGFTPIAVNDIRVYSFLEEVYSLSGRNPIHSFEISQDIIIFLREQWAGLFQTLLQEHARQKEVNVLEKLESTAETLGKLANYLIEEKSKGDQSIHIILISNHPLFSELKKILNIPYRIYFENIAEMDLLLKARKTSPISSENWDSPEYMEYVSNWRDEERLIKIKADLFDEGGRLKVVRPDEWDDDFIFTEDMPKEEPPKDDEIPF